MYNVSSERFKTDIEAWSVGDNDIFGPSAVSFRFKDEAWDRALYQEKDEGGNEYDIIEYGDPNCRKSIGWSAEDMFKHAPDAVILDAEGKPYNIDWHAITLMLWSELKRLRARVAVVDGGAG